MYNILTINVVFSEFKTIFIKIDPGQVQNI